MPDITTIGPSLRVPDVPTGPRMHPNEDLAGGLLDFARGVDRVMSAQQQAAAKMREARDTAASDDDTDFERVATNFHNEATDTREKLKATLPTPEERQDFDAGTAPLQAAIGQGVKDDSFQRAHQAMRGRLETSLGDLAGDAGAAPDGRVAAVMRNLAKDAIVRHIDSGIITPDEGKDLLKRYSSDVNARQAKRLADADPAAAAKAIAGGAFPDLVPEAREQLQRDAEGAAGMQAADRQARLKQGIGELTQSLGDGAPPSPEVLDGLDALATETGNAPARVAVAAARSGTAYAAKLARLPIARAIEDIKAMTAADPKSPAGEAKFAYGSGMIRTMARELATDPNGFAEAQGLVKVAPLDFAQAKPEDLTERARVARQVAEYYQLPQPVYLSPDERTAFGTALRQSDPDAKQRLMTGSFAAFGAADGAKLFRELGSVAPAEAHLATLAAFGGGREAIAQKGFRGQHAIDEKSVTLPEDGKFAEVEGKVIGNVFDARLTGPRAQAIAAARALYAETAVSKGLSGFSEADYTQALQQALGKGGNGGGIAERNGRKVLLPADMKEDGFTGTLLGLKDGELAAISVGGGAPVHVTLSGKVMPATAKDVRDAVLETSGYGRYRVNMNRDGGPPRYLVDGATGGYYEINLANPKRRPVPAQRIGVGRGVGDVWQRPDRTPDLASIAPPKDQSRIAPTEKPMKDQSRLPVAVEHAAKAENRDGMVVPPDDPADDELDVAAAPAPVVAKAVATLADGPPAKETKKQRRVREKEELHQVFEALSTDASTSPPATWKRGEMLHYWYWLLKKHDTATATQIFNDVADRVPRDNKVWHPKH